ncbi:hypothetical protein ACIRVK_32165 [Streptomyces sp. NPDC101152]|uniref:hypothetical protein n=1 Tax=Streptomyces sp. NPDC101152 TaxID=3366116 RepID=UPI00381DDFE9
MLRVNRLAHPDPELRSVTGFARAFGHPTGTARLSPSTVSRWENGLVPLSHSTVRRYEVLLGVAPYLLIATIDTLARYQTGGSAPGGVLDLRRRNWTGCDDLGRLDALLDQVLDDGDISGPEWDELTTRLVSGPRLVAPRRVREAVAHRLVEESTISDGLSWMLRFESLNRLLAHADWAAEAVAACANVAADRNHAAILEAVSYLDGSTHPDAARHLLRHLTRPTSDETFEGALFASVRKVRHRHLNQDQLISVADVVADLLTGGGVAARNSVLAAAILPTLPWAPAHRARLVRAAADHPATRDVVLHGRLAAPDAARTVVARVLSRLSGRHHGLGTHDILRELVDEVLHHPVFDVRLYTGMLLRASPYRAPLAASLAAEFRVPATLAFVPRAVPLLNALRVLGGPPERGVVAAITLADGLPAEVVEAALHAMGHIGGSSPDRYWHDVLRRHGERRSPRTALPFAAAGGDTRLKHLVYAMSMAGGQDASARACADPRLPAQAHALSAWWRQVPSHVRRSVLS